MVPRRITSLQHPIVKRLVKLRQEKSYREEEKRALVSGEKLVKEFAAAAPLKLFITDEEGAALPAEETIVVTPEILKKITGLVQPDGFAAEVPLPPPADLKGKNFLLVLDGLSDPGNVGTLLRTALALGWEGIILTEQSADPFNEKAIRAAQGAAFRLPLAVLSWQEAEKLLSRYTVVVADLDGTPLSETTVKKPLALVLGSESHGPSAEAKKCGRKVFIPMPGKTESMNVAAAGAILLYTLKENS